MILIFWDLECFWKWTRTLMNLIRNRKFARRNHNYEMIKILVFCFRSNPYHAISFTDACCLFLLQRSHGFKAEITK